MTATEDEFRRMWLGNVSIRNIATRCGIGRPKVHAIARRLRLPSRPRAGAIPIEDTDDILDSGMTIAEIAAKYGVTQNCACVWRLRRLRERENEPAVEVSPEEEEASASDLRLAPWVAQRAAEIDRRRDEADGRFRSSGRMLVW